MNLTRSRFLATLAVAVALPLSAQAQQFFRIGTGGRTATRWAA